MDNYCTSHRTKKINLKKNSECKHNNLKHVRSQKQSCNKKCDDEPIHIIGYDQFTEIIRHCEQDSVLADAVVVMLSKCTCCERHQIDRPTSYLPRARIVPTHCHGQSGPCNCHCRMLSRSICCQLNDILYGT